MVFVTQFLEQKKARREKALWQLGGDEEKQQNGIESSKDQRITKSEDSEPLLCQNKIQQKTLILSVHFNLLFYLA